MVIFQFAMLVYQSNKENDDEFSSNLSQFGVPNNFTTRHVGPIHKYDDELWWTMAYLVSRPKLASSFSMA